jgi:hypothetical protein
MSDKNKKLSDDVIMEKLLEELRFSALALSQKLGYKSHSSIHHILNKRNKISIDLINRIVKEFPFVNYMFLSKGELPIVVPDKLARNQFQVLFPGEKRKGEQPSYDLESFAVLKSIDAKMDIIIELLKQKKADNQ